MPNTHLDLLHAYRLMLLARIIDEREWMLSRQGKIPFVMSCRGQDATQVGLVLALRPGVDHVLPYYRDTGLVLALGMTPYELFLNLFAKADDPNSDGRQMPNHWAHNEFNIYSHSSPVAIQIPHAAGVALASHIKGEDAVTLVTFGEGVTSRSDFHEPLNYDKVPRGVLCHPEVGAVGLTEEQAREQGHFGTEATTMLGEARVALAYEYTDEVLGEPCMPIRRWRRLRKRRLWPLPGGCSILEHKAGLGAIRFSYRVGLPRPVAWEPPLLP